MHAEAKKCKTCEHARSEAIRGTETVCPWHHIIWKYLRGSKVFRATVYFEKKKGGVLGGSISPGTRFRDGSPGKRDQCLHGGCQLKGQQALWGDP